MPPRKSVPKPFDPLAPPPLVMADVAALQAVAAGTATETQQKRAMRLVVEKFGWAYENTFIPGPDGARLSDLAQGRRRVGTMLVTYLNTPLKNLRDPDAAPGQHD